MPVTDPSDEDPPFDSTVAHPARVYDYWLGGKDNFAADREAGDEVLRAKPGIRQNVRANRAFLGRCVRFLAAEAGIRQFLDVGTGIPSAGNTHEVALGVDPDSRVVYVDNDLMVLRHAQALLTSATGAVVYPDMDARDTGKILAAAAGTLDFEQPVAVMLIAVLHLIPDGDDPWRLVADLMDAVPRGSYLALTHPASDVTPDASARASRAYNENVTTPQTRRSRDEVGRLITGLELVSPGLVQLADWRTGGQRPRTCPRRRPATPRSRASHDLSLAPTLAGRIPAKMIAVRPGARRSAAYAAMSGNRNDIDVVPSGSPG